MSSALKRKTDMRRYAVLFATILACLIFVIPSAAQISEDQGLLIDWHPSGTMIACAVAESNEVVIWDTVSNTVLNLFATEDAQRDRPEWSPDGQLLAFRDSLATIAVWSNAENPSLAVREYYLDIISKVGYPNIYISEFAWHPSNMKMAIAGGSAIDVWDLLTDDYLLLPSNDRISEIADLKWFDANTLLLGDTTPHAALINAQSGAVEASFLVRLGTGIVAVSAIAPSPNRTEIALTSTIGNLDIWDPTQGVPREGYGLQTDSAVRSNLASENHITSLEWSPTGEYIAMADRGGIIHVWNANTLELVQEYDQGPVFNSVAWNPDGTQLAFGTASGGLQIVDIPPVIP